MSRKKALGRKGVFNIIVTLILAAVIIAFYKFAVSSYYDKIKDAYTDKQPDVDYVISYTTENVLGEIGESFQEIEITKEFLECCKETFGEDAYEKIINHLKENDYDESMWYDLFGCTAHVISDMVTDNITDYNYISKSTAGEDFTLAFAGDISLDDKFFWSPLKVFRSDLDRLGEVAFSPDLFAEMQNASIFCVNNESPITSEEAPRKGAYYPISSSPENVSVLEKLGVDIVNIANDRIFDYSANGFSDTIGFLDEAGIAYIGGGSDMDDASLPRYAIVGGMKIAFVSSAYITKKGEAIEATDSSAGIIYSANSSYIYNIIREASAQSDYVVVYTDWGSGKNETADATQTAMAHSFVDAGADIVIGCRSMVLQSMEYYKGKPIIYGLGNFWYETDTHNTIFLRINFTQGVPSVYCLPCEQKNAKTTLLLGTDKGNAIFERIIKSSGGLISLSQDGLLSEVLTED